MSAAAAEAPEAAVPKAGGKKKLIILIAVVLLLVLGGGGAAFFLLKKKHVEGEEDDDAGHAPAAHAKAEAKSGAVPVFVPLDPFTVNLADRDSERYAQVGITLEIEDAKTGEQLKAYMPAIRNNILMLLARKTAAELLSPEGKIKLALDIQRESLKPLGIEVEDEAADEAEAATDSTKKKVKKKKKKAPLSYPVKAAHFSNLIVQ